jgi:hypothetical protein
MLRIVEILCEMNDEERREREGRGGEGEGHSYDGTRSRLLKLELHDLV